MLLEPVGIEANPLVVVIRVLQWIVVLVAVLFSLPTKPPSWDFSGSAPARAVKTGLPTAAPTPSQSHLARASRNSCRRATNKSEVAVGPRAVIIIIMSLVVRPVRLFAGPRQVLHHGGIVPAVFLLVRGQFVARPGVAEERGDVRSCGSTRSTPATSQIGSCTV